MRPQTGFFLAALLVCTLAACSHGKPAPGPEVPRPDAVLDPVVLYSQNCAGCHGAQGREGATIPLSDAMYQALVSDDDLRNVISKGRAGTAMSAFAQSQGGMLTDEQINAIIHGMRQRWSKPNEFAGEKLPAYAAATAGDAQRGETTYMQFCASCHGTNGKPGARAGSVTDGAYLSLISDQGLRTIVIIGRPDFGAPDYRHNAATPMTDQQITDVVAWLASQRPQQPRLMNAGGAQ